MAAKATTKAPAAAKKPPVKATAKGEPGKAASSAVTSAGAKGTASATSKPALAATVTLKHLSAGLAEKHGMDKKQADTVVADVFEMLVAHLKSGDRLRLGGLGILEVKNRPARMGRNPATGAAIQIQASKKIAFRAAKELKDAI